MTAGKVTRVGGNSHGAGTKDHGTKGKHANTAKVARRRKNASAMQILHPDYLPEHEDYLIPVRDLEAEIEDGELEMIGTLIAGVQDFKVLRGSIAVLSLATSIEYAHLLTDASMISRGNVIVARLYQVSRVDLFGDPEEEDDNESDE